MAGDKDLSDYDRDKIRKQKLVLETIASHCTTTSPHQDVRLIASALQEDGSNAKLDIENLSGGYTNYTYRVFLAPKDNASADGSAGGADASSPPPDTALFAKLCFPRAFWNPDPNYVYDVQRIANEAEMLDRFAKLAPGCAATPYLLLDIDNMKLLATQWAPADEQMANQFIDGVCDLRVAKNLASAVASLHCSEVEPDFNTEARDCMITLFSGMKDELLATVQSTDGRNDRATMLAKEMGADLCTEIFDRVEESYRERSICVHSDLHAFNILVEKKPDVLHLETFGEKGSFCICDWEMCMCGPLGVDMGRVYSIPVACVIAHAIGGNCGVADGIIEFLDLYWQDYSSAMAKMGGKSDVFLLRSYRNAMAWLGWKLYAMCLFEWFIPFLPIDTNNVGAFKESLAVVGLTLLRWGFGGHEEGLSLDELHSRLNSTITNEVYTIKSTRRGGARRRRSSSILREKNRRVSDAFIGMGPASLRNSIDIDELSIDE